MRILYVPDNPVVKPAASAVSPETVKAESFDSLFEWLAKVAAAAKAMVADPHQGKSPVVAGLRSAVDHSAALLADHQKWVAANQPKPEVKG